MQSYGRPIPGTAVDAVGERQRLERRQQQAWEWIRYIQQKRADRRRTFAELDAADEAVQEATAAKWKAEGDLGYARAEYSDANLRLEKRCRRIKEINAELAELKGEG